MRRTLGSLAAAAVVVTAVRFATSERWPWRRLEVVAPPAAIAPRVHTATDTLQSGESLGELFARHGIGHVDLLELVGVLGIDSRRMRAGEVFRFDHSDGDTTAFAVTLRATPNEELRAVRGDETWAAQRRAVRWDSRLVRVEGRVASSLYDAMAAALADEPLTAVERVRLAWDLADVFQWQVDFTTDLQPADDFAVVFEREVSELGEARLGRIIASEIEVDGRRLGAYRFQMPDGREQFYDERGESLRRAFLRAPVEFRRIASGFSRSRRHPILGIWRRHQGIDYAADAGTPVLAAGDGLVTFAGWSGGYGRMVEIRHRNGIETRYAHLRGFGPFIRTGARLLQGEVIGYVGATGLANGPHLHYEFRQGGQALDPRRLSMGSGEAIPPGLLPAFQVERDRLTGLLRRSSLPADLADGSG
jgi:murein DD-endopeptidase MepM/ murein hydrolase activator NlpD